MEAPRGKIDVSVVVPTYNVAGYVAECLTSLLASEGCRIEVVVVDDASSDDTVQKVSSQFGRDERVRLERLACNSGPSHARNVGIGLARGEWLALVDADDWCESRRFARLIDLARRFDADVVSDDQHVVEDGAPAPWSTINRVSRWTHAVDEPLAFEKFVRSRHIVKPLINLSFLRSSQVCFYEAVRHSEDFLLFCELLLKGARWHMTPEAMYHYRIRKGSITNTGDFAEGKIRVMHHLLGLDEVRRSDQYVALCRAELASCRRELEVRSTRAALRKLKLLTLARRLASDWSLLPSVIRQEASVLPLRLRRRWRRLSMR